jgi:phosphate/sulfate permease
MQDIFVGIFISVVTGLLTAFFTFGILYYYFKKSFKQKAELLIDEYILIFKERLKEGFHEAGKELLPAFKEEVKRGFKEAINESISPSMIEETAKNIAKTSTSIIQNSINLLTGRWEDNK